MKPKMVEMAHFGPGNHGVHFSKAHTQGLRLFGGINFRVMRFLGTLINIGHKSNLRELHKNCHPRKSHQHFTARHQKHIQILSVEVVPIGD